MLVWEPAAVLWFSKCLSSPSFVGTLSQTSLSNAISLHGHELKIEPWFSLGVSPKQV